MLLKNKTAVLYGAAGHIGRAVAHVFAREGAQIFLTGRDAAALKSMASDVQTGGGKAVVAEIDALDAKAVEQHLAGVVKTAGGVDISFNMISYKDVQGKELSAMSIDDYLRPVNIATRTQFISSTAAARHMTASGRGVIMAITATPSRLAEAVGRRFRNGVWRNRGNDAHACRRSGAEGRASLLVAISRLAGILRGAHCC